MEQTTLTLDELLKRLQEAKAMSYPGDTPVIVSAPDSHDESDGPCGDGVLHTEKLHILGVQFVNNVFEVQTEPLKMWHE
jgi:hypothetical protein